MLSAFIDLEIDFLLVGAYVMAAHGYPRATGDIDLWVRSDDATAHKVYRAIAEFGAPVDGLNVSELSQPGIVFQIGVAPVRIDILTSINGVSFEVASNRIAVSWDGLTIPVIGLRDFLCNKRSTGRTKDLADVEQLEQDIGER
ncbi:MAG: nucleotidyltransferase [Planctomycetales bacterium]|nr:nucleotidyltransferase [Planctomycetales bacterium]